MGMGGKACIATIERFWEGECLAITLLGQRMWRCFSIKATLNIVVQSMPGVATVGCPALFVDVSGTQHLKLHHPTR